jgi:hypothetical protein
MFVKQRTQVPTAVAAAVVIHEIHEVQTIVARHGWPCPTHVSGHFLWSLSCVCVSRHSFHGDGSSLHVDENCL